MNAVKTEEVCWGGVWGHSAPVYFPRKYTGEVCWARLVPVYFRLSLIVFGVYFDAAAGSKFTIVRLSTAKVSKDFFVKWRGEPRRKVCSNGLN